MKPSHSAPHVQGARCLRHRLATHGANRPQGPAHWYRPGRSPESAAHHRVTELVDAIGEVLTGHAEHTSLKAPARRH